jgi:dedicated sortase system histidine kinase
MGYESVREMERFLLEGQEQALELTTQGISSLLGNRSDLFDPGVGVPEVIGRTSRPLPTEIEQSLSIDAAASGWVSAIGELTNFAGFGLFECGPDYQPDSLAVRHGVAIDPEQFFAYFEIDDDIVIFRDPDLVSLNNSDQLRMTVQASSGTISRYLLTTTEPGRVSIYLMRDNWREAISGEAVRELAGVLDLTERGYVIKLRIPRSLLGVGARLKFEIVDVDDVASRVVSRVISTEPDPTQLGIGRVRLATPELTKLIQPLYLSEANITIWDRGSRLRAQVGSIFPPAREGFDLKSEEFAWSFPNVETAITRFYEWILRSPARGFKDMPVDSSREDYRLLGRVFTEGEPKTERRRYGDAKLIVTAAPIWAEGNIDGAVLIKQSGNKLLSLQYRTLQRFTLLFLGVFLFLSVAILVFSTRLTYRVGRLQRETEQAATPEGRLLKDQIRPGARSSDELGSLTRSISGLLHNLGQYTRYLEKLPDTLAHELHNPLNVVNSSLENLQYHHRELADDKHLQRARNGVGRLRSIITSLTEAASLKEALSHEQDERFDLAALIDGCVEGYQAVNPKHRIVSTRVAGPMIIEGVPDRLAQMLDKLIDNAVQFGADQGLIVVSLRRNADGIELTVANDGPALPVEIVDRLFDPMVSRARDARKTHLGLGLYIVRLVAEFHNGTVVARNRAGDRGVEVVVSLPQTRVPPR